MLMMVIIIIINNNNNNNNNIIIIKSMYSKEPKKAMQDNMVQNISPQLFFFRRNQIKSNYIVF